MTELGRPIVDATGLTGEFNIDLEFAFRGPGQPPRDPLEGPTLFMALQEQLGLKLESARLAVDTLVVDSAERPGEN